MQPVCQMKKIPENGHKIHEPLVVRSTRRKNFRHISGLNFARHFPSYCGLSWQ
jgi:hypothetical protein